MNPELDVLIRAALIISVWLNVELIVKWTKRRGD